MFGGIQDHDCHGHSNSEDVTYDRDSNEVFEEMDPCGRYGRYKDILGKGAFKTVYKAFDRVEGIEVAWNQIKLPNVARSSEDMERLFSEIHLLKTLKHRHIIKFRHSWVDEQAQNLNFLTEMFSSGTLRQYCRQHRSVDIRAIKNWSRQILRGLLYLHSHDPPIIHRDLKCENIYINGNQGEVKIGDLGLAAILRQAYAARSVIGTPEFMAPELYEEEYTELVDIYAFGMCVLEMVTCDYPYSECTNAAQIYKRVTSGRKPEALNKVKDPHLRQFVEKCIGTAASRLPARELLMDPFLHGDRDKEYGKSLQYVCTGFPSFVDASAHFAPKDAEVLHSAAASKSKGGSSFLMQASVPPSSFYPRNPTHGATTNASKNLPSSHLVDDCTRQITNIQVKGKRREDVVKLCFRITYLEGDVKSIVFLFKLGFDTAISVATEMVTKLKLTKQDVSKIVERIDTALAVIAPECQSAMAVDDSAGNAYLEEVPEYRGTAPLSGATDRSASMAD